MQSRPASNNDAGLPEPLIITLSREEGREEGRASVVLRQLSLRLGPLPAPVVAQVQQLGGERLLDLADAIFDFATLADLTAWLATHSVPAAD
ncbi:MAG: DUF4351 domain-containing protein [Chloroflexaceae bacterium]|nr:DUF4351 domain-containing protein [Chloroflexaceae bacterium]